jgi:hypothetical protein
MWRALFGRGFGPLVRQTTKWMNGWMIYMYMHIYHGTVYRLRAVPKCHNWSLLDEDLSCFPVFWASHCATTSLQLPKVTTSSRRGGLPTPMILPATSRSYWQDLPWWTGQCDTLQVYRHWWGKPHQSIYRTSWSLLAKQPGDIRIPGTLSGKCRNEGRPTRMKMGLRWIIPC